MAYTIRNRQPSVLFIPDADLRLETGQTAEVAALTPQMASLLSVRMLEVMAHDVTPSAPVVALSASDESAPAASSDPDHRPEAKRSGRKTAEPTVTMEPRDDAQ